jgi:hypothetical protein
MFLGEKQANFFMLSSAKMDKSLLAVVGDSMPVVRGASCIMEYIRVTCAIFALITVRHYS